MHTGLMAVQSQAEPTVNDSRVLRCFAAWHLLPATCCLLPAACCLPPAACAATDSSGMYCVKQYDFAGDGVRTADYMTITAGAGAVQFCKLQCAAEPQCQFSVTSRGKCFMKQNILSGSFGTTKPDTTVDASCVKGEQNWALAALQV